MSYGVPVCLHPKNHVWLNALILPLVKYIPAIQLICGEVKKAVIAQ
jgi:hypothetical protein